MNYEALLLLLDVIFCTGVQAEDKKRKKKKPRLDMHDQQLFLDGPDVSC